MLERRSRISFWLLDELAKKVGAQHKFVSAGSSWANGKQERLNRSVGELFRTLLSENQLQPEQWPLIVPLVQLVINSTPLPSLMGRSPMECFLALEPVRPLDYFLEPKTGKARQIVVNEAGIAAYVDNFHVLIKEREAELVEVQAEAHAAVQTKQEHKRDVKPLDVSVGDYVMVRNTDKAKAKFARNWRGPAQVVNLESEGHLVTVRFLGADRGFKPQTFHVLGGRRIRRTL